MFERRASEMSSPLTGEPFDKLRATSNAEWGGHECEARMPGEGGSAVAPSPRIRFAHLGPPPRGGEGNPSSCLQLFAPRYSLFAPLFLLYFAALAADTPPEITSDGFKLVWVDEFDKDGAPDPAKWTYEIGFIRNNEAQLYLRENAVCKDGNLIIEARRERKPNPYAGMNKGWQFDRKQGEYTSAMLTTWGKGKWLYGRFEMRGRIDVRQGMWPAWWTLGANIHRVGWPKCGEIDIMEYYGAKGLMSNVCWGPWNTGKKPLSVFNDPDWSKKFHVWRMDWDEKELKFYVDGALWNAQDLTKTTTSHGNPFQQPQYMLLNLAIGGDWGGDPSKTEFPGHFEVDYVRVYQQPGHEGTAAVTAAASPAKDGLVAYWKLDEKAGTVVEDSAGANKGEMVKPDGAARVEGKVGGALEFNGASYVKVPDSAALKVEKAITVAAWIKLADATGEQCVAAKGTGFVFFQTKPGTKPVNVLNIGGGPTAHWLSFPYATEAAAFVGGWHHIAFTYDGTNVTNYMDGKPDGAPEALTGDLSPGWDWLGIGTNGAWADKFFKGAIDDVRIYSRALSADEIGKLFGEAK
jgi:beta-glucanase (GH16 family)